MATPITRDDAKLMRLLELTEEGLSIEKIEARTAQDAEPLKASSIAHAWRTFGGKERFVRELRRRKKEGEPLALSDFLPKTKVQLSDDELLKVADFLMRGKPLETALEKIKRLDVSEADAKKFIVRTYQSMTAFFARYGPRVHEQRQQMQRAS